MQSAIAIPWPLFTLLVGLICTIIGFLYGRVFSDNKTSKLYSEVKDAVTELKFAIQGMKDTNAMFIKNCDERHEKLDNLISEIDK